MAQEPSGERAIYKLSLNVSGSGAAKFKLSGGYVAANVIDALSGGVKEPADLYVADSLTEQRANDISELSKQFGQRLKTLANGDPIPQGGPAPTVEDYTHWFARLIAARSLSTDDLISAGQQGTTSVYGFRKLVYFVSSNVIPLAKFENELNSLQQSTVALAQSIRQVREARAAATKARVQAANTRRSATLGFLTQNLQPGTSLTDWTPTQFLNFFATVKGVQP